MSYLLKSLLLAMLCCYTAVATCPDSGQIHCKTRDHCTRIGFLCDGDNDCGDNSDEDSTLCAAWRNSDCPRSNAKCTRLGGTDCIPISRYCELTEPPCEGTLDPRICKMLNLEKITDLDSIIIEETTVEPTDVVPTLPSIHYSSDEIFDAFEERLDSTIRHADCPQLYTKIGKQCVSVFFIGNLTWMESRAFCQAFGGDLFTIKPDLSNYLAIMEHFNKNQLTKDFWVGGLYKNSSLGWKWVDETDMSIGSPIWAVRHYNDCSVRYVTSSAVNKTEEANYGYCYHYKQAPGPGDRPSGHCAAMTYENYFYVSDEDCTTRKSPLCVLPEEHPKQGI